jgi:hypothetical protein
VRRPEHLQLRLPGGGGAGAGQRADLAIFLRQIRREQQLADIVQQAGRKSLVLRFLGRELAPRQVPGQSGRIERVPPKRLNRKAGCGDSVEMGVGMGQQDERLGRLETEKEHRLRRAGHLALHAERRGVDQLQELGRDSEVLGDDGADIVQRCLGRMQFANNLEINRGRAGQFVHLRHQLFDRVVGKPEIQLRRAVQRLQQFRRVAWFR